MGQSYPYSKMWIKKIVVILHVYVARAIFLLFCNHYENESYSREMYIGVAGSIFTR